MIQYIIENLNEIKLLLSYWNYLIIKHQISPSLCVKGIEPYSHLILGSQLQRQLVIFQMELLILEVKYERINSQLGLTVEIIELQKQIAEYERSI